MLILDPSLLQRLVLQLGGEVRTRSRGKSAAKTHLFDDSFKFSDTVLKARSLVFGIRVCLVHLVDAESGLLILRSIRVVGAEEKRY